MCEIIVCVLLSMRIAKIAKSKGRSPVGWVILFIALWIGGELTGAVVGAILLGGEDPFILIVPALIGAALGAATGFAIVNSLSPLETEDQYWDRQSSEYEDELEDRPRRPRKEFDPADESYREKFDPYHKKDEPEPPEDTYRGKGDE
jgi:hypothetical protein